MSSLRGLRQIVLAAALAAAAACAHVEPGREVLRSIDFEGNESIPASAIEERLALTETPIWPWSDPYYFDAGTLGGDRRRLVRFYQANGFYEARVRTRVRREDGDVHVTFRIEEGPPTRVERVEVRGLEALPADVRDALEREELPLRVGDRVTEEAWEATRALLASRLRDRGYGDAAVEGEVVVDVDRRAATAVVEVRPGARLRFGRVVVTGAVDVPRETILESVRRDVPEGSRYSDERLAEAEQNLLAMGVFGGVRVGRGPTDPASNRVPVVAAVREAPFQTVRAGVGAGIDPGSVSVRATGDYTHRNFLGGLRTLRFENELGYALLRNGATVLAHGVVGESALDFTQPGLVRSVDANVRVGYEHDIDLAYRFDALTGRIGFPIRLHRTLTFTPSWNVQRIWLTENVAIAPGGGSGNCQLEQGDCVLAFLEERLAWDRRDNPIETRAGWYTALAAAQGRTWLGSRSSYDRVLGEVRWFQPLPWDWVLALKVEAGALFPARGERSPITERFYAGGSNSVRGFAWNQLSPWQLRRGATSAERIDPRDAVPIGGDALLEGSAEVRIPIVGALGTVLFVDVGNVARDVREDAGELRRPNLALGTGLRYRTPFGPVRLDVGWLAVRNLPCVVEDGACGTAQVDTSPFALHFSIGEAF